MNRIQLILLLFIVSFSSYSQQNTILIIADDLSPDYLGFYEDAKDTANLPNLRKLQDKGVRFTEAWSYPYCSVARASILTGKYPFRTGVGYVVNKHNSAPGLDTSEVSISRLLKNSAPVKYNTACVGKWHIQRLDESNSYYPNLMGFDLFSGFYMGELPDYFNYPRVKNGRIDTVTTYATTQTVNDAIGWLDTMNTSKPFFLWLAFNAPHEPFHLPPAKLITNKSLSGSQRDINKNPKLYFKAMLEAMDTEIGRLIQYLDTQNLLDSTNIIFIGDNGNAVLSAQKANPKKAKGTLYNYGVRVPLIINGPAVVDPGRISHALVSTTDLFSTIADLSNFSTWADFIPASKKPIDSRSLFPILKNQNNAIRSWNFSEMFIHGMKTKGLGKTVRNAGYQLIRYDNGIDEFYKLAQDTFEIKNLLPTSLDSIDLNNYRLLFDSLTLLLGSNCKRSDSSFLTSDTVYITNSFTLAENNLHYREAIKNRRISNFYQRKKQCLLNL